GFIRLIVVGAPFATLNRFCEGSNIDCPLTEKETEEEIATSARDKSASLAYARKGLQNYQMEVKIAQ
ncbi:MAG: hypothetical protein ACP5GW_05920, partial [Caldisericaceae bacterium]